MFFKRFLTLSAAAGATIAQTIVVDGEKIPADQDSVAPASEEVVVPSSTSDSIPASDVVQLTDAVLANLTDLQLTDVDLFAFGNDSEDLAKRSSFGQCKTAPGDVLYPSTLLWKIFDLLLGGALIKTVPYASPCYKNFDNYDEAVCDYITTNWYNDSYIQIDDPTAINSILFEGITCVPPEISVYGTSCAVGGFPSYSVNVSNVAQVQLAVNLARNLNLRLVIKNTGHDFGGKSTGYGALSIWTHNLKSYEFYESYTEGDYTGPAFQFGVGIQAFELYKIADENGVVVLGSEGETVGVMGGYILGGGHSPLSPLYGMASDSVLSMNVVTADGRFITASDKENSDLFWALRGGGGSTYGVVTSIVVKAHPKLDVITTMSFTIESGVGNVTDDMFWQAVRAFWDRFPEFARDNGNYEYFTIDKGTTGSTLSVAPWFAPNFNESALRTLVAPLFDDWASIGVDVDVTFNEFESFYAAWSSGFALEPWASTTIRQASQLLQVDRWDNETVTNTTFEAVKATIEDGLYFIAFNIWAGVEGYPDTAVNPGWRTAIVHAIGAALWDDAADEATKKAASDKLTFDWMQSWRDVSPVVRAYMSESDYIQPDFQECFWGENYARALELKKKWDPSDVFYATNAVGSEKWALQGMMFGNLPDQNSKLCLA